MTSTSERHRHLFPAVLIGYGGLLAISALASSGNWGGHIPADLHASRSEHTCKARVFTSSVLQDVPITAAFNKHEFWIIYCVPASQARASLRSQYVSDSL